jgi:HAE1 family hydrophobic/amphiphilic exporter-1
MQKLAEISIRRPVFATMLVLALVVVGITAYLNLGVDRSPRVDVPTIYISTRLPGASPVEIETLISQPIEETVNTVEGITELRSISGNGSSFVIVQFDLRRDALGWPPSSTACRARPILPSSSSSTPNDRPFSLSPSPVRVRSAS